MTNPQCWSFQWTLRQAQGDKPACYSKNNTTTPIPSEAGIAFVAHSIIKMEAVEPLKVFGYFLFAIYALTSLWLLLNGLIQLHLLWHYKKRKPRQADTLHSSDQPFVSIPVPVYINRWHHFAEKPDRISGSFIGMRKSLSKKCYF